EAMFAAFDVFFETKIISKTSNVLCLSATPSLLLNKYPEIKYLPNKFEHYDAHHSKGYCFEFNNLNKELRTGDLLMSCSIDATQKKYNTHIKSLKNDSNKVIIHSDFIKKDRERIMGIITNSFGKGGAK